MKLKLIYLISKLFGISNEPKINEPKMKTFKKIPNSTFEITNEGTLRNRHGRILKKIKLSNGYEVYNIVNEGVKGPKMVSHYVMLVWGPPAPSDKHIIHHKDFDKTNHHIENLEWCTKTEIMKRTWVRNRKSSMTNMGRPGKSIVQYKNNKPIFVYKTLKGLMKKRLINLNQLGTVVNTDKEYEGYKYRWLKDTPINPLSVPNDF